MIFIYLLYLRSILGLRVIPNNKKSWNKEISNLNRLNIGEHMNTKGFIKSAAFLAVTSITTATMADTNTLYGDFRYSGNSIEVGDDSSTSGNNNASRFGLKGTWGEEDGISAFYHLQVGVNVDGGDAFTQRFFFAGIKGNFGKLTYGRTSTPYKMAGLKVDPFYDTSAGAGLGGATYGLSGLTNGWTDNSLAYSSKKIGNLSFNASTYLDDSTENNHDTNVGFTYNQGALTAGVQLANVSDTGVIAKSTPDSSATRLHARYKMDKWSLGASYETIDVNGASDDQSYFYLSSTYQATDKVKLAFSYGVADKVNATTDGSGFNLGAFYQLLKKTNVYVLYSGVSYDEINDADRSTLAIGVSHKFSFQ